jgi:hypothetical protein
MAQTRFYPGCASYLPALSRFLEQRFGREGYEVQLLEDHDGRSFQMRKRYREGWIKTVSTLTGLDTAATVAMRMIGDDLDVTFGGAKWLDKAAVAGVGLFASLGLLLVPAGIGAYKQHELIEDLTTAVDNFFRSRDSVGR